MSHYFQTPNGPENRRKVKVRFWDTDWDFTTADGVFSGGGLDLGTAVLLRESVPPAGASRLLDLGCGYGVLAVALAAACPDAVVDAVDTNERVIVYIKLSLVPLLPEQRDSDTRYDEIWSNPPIRIGKAALHELLLTWLPRLLPGGTARLVVSRNLGADSLQNWLKESGYRCERVASAKGYRVFAVTPEGAG